MKYLEITDPDSVSSLVLHDGSYVSYQIYFELPVAADIHIGRLGRHFFPRGSYVYTGSARKNMRARILRHIARQKKKYWHVDYLLSRPGITFIRILLSEVEECELNRRTPGRVTVAGFGSSDCTSGCISHLKFITGFTEKSNRHSQTNARSVRRS